ncbi:MAG: class I SAM-dependent methyltransferase [Calothrix sp. SM1_7_51]|nr:class I SAM-dependent methyltransferase [Calothrix sp. SM1_7_51]
MGRFHTNNGKFVGIKNLPNAFISLKQATFRKLFKQYPELPWMPFELIQTLNRLIQPTWNVYEIGSGMSTVWLSQRAASVISIEASEEWYTMLGKIISDKGIKNVDLRCEWVGNKMSDLTAVTDTSLDLLIVDGGPRGDCVINGFRKVKQGGYLYLDNWDSPGYYPGAEDFLEQHKHEIEWKKSFIDYVPGMLGVFEGLLIRKS